MNWWWMNWQKHRRPWMLLYGGSLVSCHIKIGVPICGVHQFFVSEKERREMRKMIYEFDVLFDSTAVVGQKKKNISSIEYFGDIVGLIYEWNNIKTKDFEDAIRNAISLGGDSDTLAAITGSIAEAYFGVKQEHREFVKSKLDDRLRNICEEFAGRI
ncbi:MAG: ADP-ribosylglycohydrolase family protein [Phascolarctobacterium sp.]|nr:ADP-ribosylglycohydrolase family protein [Candidatus Phascolarctobacterium equi]